MNIIFLYIYFDSIFKIWLGKKAPNSSDTKELSAQGTRQLKSPFLLTVGLPWGKNLMEGTRDNNPKKPLMSSTQNEQIRLGNRTNSADPQRKQFAEHISNFDVLR